MSKVLSRICFVVIAVTGVAVLTGSISGNKSNTSYPKETGPAKFLRDHDTALAQAKKSGKPVFAFFQEVPG